MIGTLGLIPFQADAKIIRTFDEFTRRKAARWAQHDRMGRKPLLQFGGPGLDEISFTMRFDAAAGVNPRRELDNLSLMADGGKAYRLVIGGKPIGASGLWVVSALQVMFEAIDNRGDVLIGAANISLKEYVVK